MAEQQVAEYFGDKIIGQAQVRTMLADTLARDRVAHAYMFSGLQGIGKTAVALEFASLLLCDQPSAKPCGSCVQCYLSRRLQHPDLHIVLPLPSTVKSKKRSEDGNDEESDPAEALGERLSKLFSSLAKDPYTPIEISKGKESKDKDDDGDSDSSSGKSAKTKTRANSIRLGQIKALLRTAARKPYQSKRRVFVILQADTMNEEAQNCLLKTLEEPAYDSFFLLVTEDERQLKPTIRSRCQRIPLLPLNSEEITNALLKEKLSKENAETIAAFSNGNFAHAREMIGHDIKALQSRVIDFLGSAAVCNPLDLPKAIESLMEFDGLPEGTGLELLEVFLRDVALCQAVPTETPESSPMVFGSFRDRIGKLLTAFPLADFPMAVKAVEEARDRLDIGYTRDQVLMVMSIRLSEALGQKMSVKNK